MQNERQDKNHIRMHKNKFTAILLAAVIGAAVTTAFSLFRVANSDHFNIVANRSDIDRLVKSQESYVSRVEHSKDINSLREYFDTRVGALENHIDTRFDLLEKQIN